VYSLIGSSALFVNASSVLLMEMCSILLELVIGDFKGLEKAGASLVVKGGSSKYVLGSAPTITLK
jgi:hypothetical protein